MLVTTIPFACVFDGSSIKVYFDGFIQSGTVFSGTPVSNTGYLNIGRWAFEGTRYFHFLGGKMANS